MYSGMPMSIKASEELVRCLNDVRLEEEEIIEAIRAAIDACDSGECCLRSSVLTAIQLFPAAPNKARAVICRLRALATMMENNELKNWMQPDGATIIHAAQKSLIAAVACHPLSLVDGDISFEKESFLQRILKSAEPRGNRQS
jgi:hypothetical protein